MMVSIKSSILYRFNLILKNVFNAYFSYSEYKISRDRAHFLRKQIITRNGLKFVDKKLKNEIKEYSREYFGSSSYWPWLAVYAELRGEFIQGWIPNDYYRFNLLHNVNPEKFMSLSEAKTLDHRIFKGSAISPQFIKLNGKFYNELGEFKSAVEIEEMLSMMDCELVIKPDNGKGGKGVIFRKATEISLTDIPLNSDFIVQPVIEQHDYLKSLNPTSVNTFRVFTFINLKGEVVVKFIILRFGTNGSRVDNSTGGVGGWIIIQSDGVSGSTAYNSKGQTLGGSHPDTVSVYSELNFPFIENVSKFCEELHKSFPYNGIVGWDVAVDEKGEPVLIEWNANNPGFWPIEANYGPFFKQEVTDKLFEVYN